MSQKNLNKKIEIKKSIKRHSFLPNANLYDINKIKKMFIAQKHFDKINWVSVSWKYIKTGFKEAGPSLIYYHI